jgi:integrase/recombinase XerD
LYNKGKQRYKMAKNNTFIPGSIITYTKGRLYKVKLRGKIQSKGTISLYLDYYRGYKTDESGNPRPIKQYEYLNLHIINNPVTTKQRQDTKERLELAYKIREKRESGLEHSKEGLVSPQVRKTNFLDYFENFLNTYQNKDKRLVKNCFVKFKEYAGVDYLSPSDITPEYINGFKGVLMEKLNGETPYNYFTKIKKVCKQAVKDRLFTINPAEDISMSRPNGVKKEILSFDEISKLASTDCGNPEIKKAFLLCCNTGLRFCDVKTLRWKDIDFSSNLIRILQNKVKKSSMQPYVNIDLNKNVLSILGNNKGEPDESVFKLPSIESAIGTLKTWTKKAGIEKNITWHSSRHSFATNLLILNTDIKTVSGLLGHSDLKHTQKYTHLINELKKQAVNKIPDLSL